MKLIQFKYWERSESGEEWEIEKLTFGKFNLIVGRNATGKTRLLKAISRVAGEFSGEAQSTRRVMQVEFIPDEPPPAANASPETAAAADPASLRTAANAEWGRRAQYFPFAGRMNFKTHGPGESLHRLELPYAYQRACETSGPSFRDQVLQAMQEVGYTLSDVLLAEPRPGSLELLVKEPKRATYTPVRWLSQGQQRTLALITFLALLESDPRPATVLIDDFGEGLDFEHAQRFTKSLLNRLSSSPLQFIIATNDRYVMNAVPLEYWSVLVEEGSKTLVFNYANSKERFDSFKFTGLCNFDFFSMDFAEREA